MLNRPWNYSAAKLKTIGQFAIYLLKECFRLQFSPILYQNFELCFQHPDIYIKFAAVTLRKKEQKHKQIKTKKQCVIF